MKEGTNCAVAQHRKRFGLQVGAQTLCNKNKARQIIKELKGVEKAIAPKEQKKNEGCGSFTYV